MDETKLGDVIKNDAFLSVGDLPRYKMDLGDFIFNCFYPQVVPVAEAIELGIKGFAPTGGRSPAKKPADHGGDYLGTAKRYGKIFRGSQIAAAVLRWRSQGLGSPLDSVGILGVRNRKQNQTFGPGGADFGRSSDTLQNCNRVLQVPPMYRAWEGSVGDLQPCSSPAGALARSGRAVFGRS